MWSSDQNTYLAMFSDYHSENHSFWPIHIILVWKGNIQLYSDLCAICSSLIQRVTAWDKHLEIRTCWFEQGLCMHILNFKISITISLYQTVYLNSVLSQVYDEMKNPFLLSLLCQKSLWEDIRGKKLFNGKIIFILLFLSGFWLTISRELWKLLGRSRSFFFGKYSMDFEKRSEDFLFVCLFVYFFILWTISTGVYKEKLDCQSDWALNCSLNRN